MASNPIQKVGLALVAALIYSAVAMGCDASSTLQEITCRSDTQCEGDSICVDGFCVAGEPGCDPGLTDCDGLCVDLLSDHDNCGSCGNPCVGTVQNGANYCTQGICSIACASGFQQCEPGLCVDVSDDLDHCGGCNRECVTNIPGAVATCQDSECGFSCTGGLIACGDQCVNTDENVDFCGSCGNSCEAGKTCQEGACVDVDCDPRMRPFGGGEGTAEDPYRLCAPEHLQGIGGDEGEHLSAHFQLDDHLEMAGRSVAPIGRGGQFLYDEDRYEQSFNGVFDGQGHQIRDLTISSPQLATGLFGVIGEAGEIYSVELANITVEGNSWVGAVAGVNLGRVEDVWVSGTISGNREVGGIAGRSAGALVDLSADVTVVASQRRAGGLVGTQTGGLIERSDSAGQVTVGEGGLLAGGLIAEQHGEVRESLSTASVSIEQGQWAGGLIALVGPQGIVVDSYATGSVSAATGVGGLVGRIDGEPSVAAGQVHTSFSSGAVVGDDLVGGLVADNDGVVSNSYWNVDTSQLAESAGGQGLTDEEFEDSENLLGFDFEDVWTVIGGRLQLQWESAE